MSFRPCWFHSDEKSLEMRQDMVDAEEVKRIPIRLLVSPDEAAHLLGVSRSKLYQMIATGEIISIKHGRSRLVPVAALSAWVEQKIGEQSP